MTSSSYETPTFTLPDWMQESVVNSSSGEKLRTTCDSCASSKVRCNKQKPICRRCTALNLDCVYGPSRRKGKPPGSRSGTSRFTNQPPHCLESQLDGFVTALAPLTSTDTSNTYDRYTQESGDIMNAFHTIADNDAILSGCMPQESLWSPFDPQSPMQSSRQTGSEGTVENDLDRTSVSQLPSLSSSKTVSLTYKNGTAGLADDRSGINNSIHDCIGVALSTLTDLHGLVLSPQSSSGSKESSTNPSSDQILKTTRRAVQSLQGLLNRVCTTCSHDSSMPFLLGTICSKVLGWYRAVYYAIVNISPLLSSADTTCPLGEEVVSITSITVGNFELDHEVETRMKAQLLLSELQNVRKVCEELAQRNRERSNDFRTAERGIHDSFEQFLRSSLNDLVAKLDAFCASKH